ncbi:MAG TPA: FAD-dependent oxidoreductase, partial [Stellaceae bacterium]|nr:FAD-dependent oxidoreductase [Stellaceae bacterium]
HSTRATDFMTPKTTVSGTFRDAALGLAERHPFARGLVNSGRLSRPATLDGSPLNTADVDAFTSAQRPGSSAADAPIGRPDGTTGWLLRELQGGFTLLCFGDCAAAEGLTALSRGNVPVAFKQIGPGALGDPAGKAADRYDATPSATYLIRPDQHVAGRWRRPDAARIRAALDRALALQE